MCEVFSTDRVPGIGLRGAPSRPPQPTALIYAVLRNDVSGGFTIASYLIACLALVGALLAAGEWFGLAAPDASAFQLDLETGSVVTNGDVGRFVGSGLVKGYDPCY